MSIAVYSQLRFILTLCHFISQTKDDAFCHSSVKQRAALELHKDIVHMNQQENTKGHTLDMMVINHSVTFRVMFRISIQKPGRPSCSSKGSEGTLN